MGTDRPAHQRIAAFDVARGAGLVGMVAVHVVYHWAQPTAWTGLPAAVLSVAGGPLAMPVFALLLGASLAFSSRTGRGELAVRGLRYLVGALVLNLVRGAIPLALARGAGVAPAGTESYSVWGLAVAVDVLALAGATLLLVGAAGPIVRTPRVALALAVLAAVIAPVVRPLAPTEGLPGALAGILVATGPTVYYPVLPWAAFVLLGIAYGEDVRRGPAELRVAAWGVAGACLAAVGGIALWRDLPAAADIAWYWQLPPALAATLAGVALAWTAVCGQLVRLGGGSLAVRLLASWGRRTTRVYVAHWPIVAWGVGVVGFRTLDGPASVVAILAVIGATNVGATVPYRIVPAVRMAIDRRKAWAPAP